MKKSLIIPLILLFLFTVPIPVPAISFWHDILILKWDQDDSADVSGYVIKVKITRTDGVIIRDEHRAGRVTEYKLDVIRDAEHEISVIPVNGAGSRLDPIYELNFVPHGIPR